MGIVERLVTAKRLRNGVALTLVLSLAGLGHADTPREPVTYSAELDITGPAAVPILLPLGDDAALVRYVPCCNIYGGVLTVARSSANPLPTREGLPKKLLSDYVVLEPDGLTASTAGLYFRFRYNAPDEDTDVVAYEWRDDAWREILSYDIDRTQQLIDFHCPDGGVFVIGTARK